MKGSSAKVLRRESYLRALRKVDSMWRHLVFGSIFQNWDREDWRLLLEHVDDLPPEWETAS